MYNPHEHTDYNGEMEMMSNGGRLVKARLPEQPAPNVGWFWFPLGNCHACKNYQVSPPKCLSPKITPAQFFDEYMLTNTCPEFVAGIEAKTAAGNEGKTNKLDVMKAVGLVLGKPSQKVIVIHDRPWSLPLAIRAHEEEGIFLNMGRFADAIALRGLKNDPSRGEYVDLDDDLESTPPVPAAQEPLEE